MRHGNTGQADVDADRQITERGERQAAAFRAAYGDTLLSSVKHAFCSPVARTTTTARLLGFHDAGPLADLYFGAFITDDMRVPSYPIPKQHLRELDNHFTA